MNCFQSCVVPEGVREESQRQRGARDYPQSQETSTLLSVWHSGSSLGHS